MCYLDLGNNTVVAGSHLDSGHLGNAEGDCLTLGGHDDDLLVELDARLVAEQTGDHELGTIANGVDGRVFDDDTLVGKQECLERSDRSSQVRLVVVIVVNPLGVENVVHRDHGVLLPKGK